MIRIRLLGETSVRVGRTRVKPASAVQFALTLFLAVTAGAPVSRARLLELFWPHMDAETARHALRQMLYRMRRAGLVLEEAGESLLVARDAVDADFVDAFDPAWGERATAAELDGAAHFLEDITLLSLPDFREWIDALRERVVTSARRVLLDRVAVARREGRWARVEDLARLCLAIDPLNEQATLARAEALAMSGAKSSALRTLDAYVEDLGDRSREIALPARVLRERIAENFTFIRNVPQAWQRFVGRSEELARCHAVIDGAAAGTGATCLVSGPSGIGKTRLAQEMLSVAKLRGLSTTTMRLESRDRERALSLFTELVPALIQLPGGAACAPESMRVLVQFTRPDDDAHAAELAIDAPVIRERIRRAIVDAIGAVCDEAPLVVLVDDAHNVDPTSLAMLRGLMETGEGRRVVWLLCGQGLDRIEWAQTLPGVPVVLRLSGLTGDECGALASTFFPESGAEDASHVLASCYGATRGNPLFVKEWMREWQASGAIPTVPDPIREALQKRLRLLSGEALRALQACCLLGPLATPSTLGEVLELDMATTLRAIEELDAADLLATHPSNPLEIHELTGNVVRELMSPAHASVLHFRIGQCLEARTVSSWSPRMAWAASAHLYAAGEEERAVGLLRQCGRHLVARSEWPDAINTFARALRFSPQAQERHAIAADLVQAHIHAAQYETAVDVAEAALSSPMGTTADTNQSTTLIELLAIEARRLQGADSRAVISELKSIAHRPELSQSLFLRAIRSLAAEADNICDRRSLAEVRTLLSRRFAEPPALDVDYQMAMTILLYADGRFIEALSSCERSLAIQRARGACIPTILARRDVTLPLIRLRRVDDAIAHLTEAYADAANMRLWAVAARLADRMSSMYFEKREREGALIWIERAAADATKANDRLVARSILNQRIKSDAHLGTHLTSLPEVAQYRHDALSDYNIRRRTEDLAAILHFMVSAGQTSEVHSLRDALAHSVEDARGWMDLAYAYSALLSAEQAAGLASTPRLPIDMPRVDAFIEAEPWYLTAAVQGDVTTLYSQN